MNNLSPYYEGIRSEIINFIPQKYNKVLEVGCGRGGFKKNLSNDCEYWGIEPYQEAANIASQELHNVLIGTFDDVFDAIPDNYFDLIICNDVIEHMLDHHDFYKKIKCKCTKDAYMIGSIPNVRYIMNLYNLLIKKDWEYKDEGILDRTHLRFFTLKSIIKDFKEAEFHVEKLYGINKIQFSKRKLNTLGMYLFQCLFSGDTKFLQFGFRVKVNNFKHDK